MSYLNSLVTNYLPHSIQSICPDAQYSAMFVLEEQNGLERHSFVSKCLVLRNKQIIKKILYACISIAKDSFASNFSFFNNIF